MGRKTCIKLFDTMNALEKLAEKNRKHQDIVSAEKKPVQLMALNYVSFLIIVYFEIFSAVSVLSFKPLIAAFSSFIFSFLVSSFGSDMVIKHWLRIILLAICHLWFCYYWIWEGDIKMSFLPLAVVFVLWRKWFYWTTFKKLRNGF